MNILEVAIKAEGSVNGLAKTLGVKQNVISNWRKRGLPKPWDIALSLKYAIPSKTKEAA
jgi:hypothetical protein